MRILTAAGFAMAVVFSAAQAEEQLSPERLALAKQVMELNGSAATYANYDKNLDLMIAQIRDSVPGIDEKTITDLKQIANEEFAAVKPDLIDGTIKIYARHFSEDDLKALIAFLKTDAGKHFAAETPKLSAECIQLTAPFSKRFMARVQHYIMDKIAAEKAAKDKSQNK